MQMNLRETLKKFGRKVRNSSPGEYRGTEGGKGQGCVCRGEGGEVRHAKFQTRHRYSWIGLACLIFVGIRYTGRASAEGANGWYPACKLTSKVTTFLGIACVRSPSGLDILIRYPCMSLKMTHMYTRAHLRLSSDVWRSSFNPFILPAPRVTPGAVMCLFWGVPGMLLV